MRYSILVTANPFTSSGIRSAWHFCDALLESGHEIEQVFFYQDAVLIGNQLAVSAQDETNWTEKWQALSSQYDFPLRICVAAALRRGILNEEEARRWERHQHNLADNFELIGLGQLAEAHNIVDRVVCFR